MSYTESNAEDKELIARMVRLLQEKLAEEILVLDLQGLSGFADYFLICNAQTEKHAQALCDHLEEVVKREFSLKPLHVEGYVPGHWVLLDYVTVIVHIFLPSMRDYYGLERLWGDAPDVTQKFL